MTENTPAPTMEDLLQGVESRVLLSISARIKTERESLLQQAQEALAAEQLDIVITEPLQQFVDDAEHRFKLFTQTEQRKRAREYRAHLEECVGGVVLAHMWQAENDAARRLRRKLPH